ncbi:hypothetical protein [Sulfolobus acidocaldarius]|uniref:VapB-type antitoxin n=3 Tax=Sulfolobus acidocaldarius TaxID=2285 RepID=A0A0U3GVD0_9CREN|nr:hypothetical protein [Sulfolobus acidocaldarius]AGE71868.1 hypothetical protein SacN8_09555 [Sulfolobus acidocaldarius N8]AGE74140.1 hypothetical protein SacRon12I_09575 [Sulfolobus acidocaldarius Ron12/I]ALU29953.1 hypothetical protein ATY89_08400 [Sulfolobus acidocaldarius]ALU32697.1 hypothetical protein ATZ20_11415 [Sulfolobus acidocaldarius]WCM35736.1 hypothetical protein GO597_10550 [Sulfolobus acidocaldarius DSM 639]
MVGEVEKGEKLVTIKVKARTKQKLIKLIGKLEMKYGRKYTVDDAINYLLKESKVKRPELLDQVFGVAKGVELYEMLKAGRSDDEDRIVRKFSP